MTFRAMNAFAFYLNAFLQVTKYAIFSRTSCIMRPIIAGLQVPAAGLAIGAFRTNKAQQIQKPIR